VAPDRGLGGWGNPGPRARPDKVCPINRTNLRPDYSPRVSFMKAGTTARPALPHFLPVHVVARTRLPPRPFLLVLVRRTKGREAAGGHIG
jgi:hypothetical protein